MSVDVLNSINYDGQGPLERLRAGLGPRTNRQSLVTTVKSKV